MVVPNDGMPGSRDASTRALGARLGARQGDDATAANAGTGNNLGLRERK